MKEGIIRHCIIDGMFNLMLDIWLYLDNMGFRGKMIKCLIMSFQQH